MLEPVPLTVVATEKQIPLTLGLAGMLLGGIVTLIIMLTSLGDRFVSQTAFDLQIKVLSAEFTKQISEVRSDLKGDIADLRADLAQQELARLRSVQQGEGNAPHK